MNYILSILLLFIIGCSSQNVIENENEDAIIHSYSGMKFKSQLGSFSRGEQKVYDDKGNNTSFIYEGDVKYHLILTIYIYPVVDDDEIYKQYPSGTEINYDDEVLKGHFNHCKDDIKKAEQKNPSLKTNPIKDDKIELSNIKFLYTLYNYEMFGEKFESSLYLTFFRNSFLKIRVTYDKNHKDEVNEMVKNLLNDINWEDSKFII